MKILVTGGGGFLGQALCRGLVERGHEVTSFNRGHYPELDALGVRQVRGDLADRNATVHFTQHGLIFLGGMVMGWALMKVYEAAPAYLLALAAGFLLVGPALCLGLYRVSQKLERGEAPDFGDSLLAFEARIGPLAL